MTVDDSAPAIRPYLAAYVRCRRRAAAVAAGGWAATAAVAWAVLACSADRLRPLPVTVRTTLLAVEILGPLLILCRPLARLFRRFDPVAAAAAVERQHPAFGHRLVTAASPGGSPGLRAALDADVAAVITTTGPACVPRRPAVAAWAAATLAAVAFAGLSHWPWLDLPDLSRRLLHPTAGTPAVTTTHLSVRPGDTAVAQGRPVTVTAAADPPAGDAGVVLHVSDDAGRTWAERPMPAADGRPTATVADAGADLRYFVTAGDAVSPTYAVRVRRVPAVLAWRVRLDFPAAAHRPPTTTADAAGQVDAPAGTAVTVDVVATIPLRAATLTVGTDRVETTPTADPSVRRARFVVRRDAPLAVQLTAADGTPGTGPRSARVRVRRAGDADVPGFADQQRAYRAALERR